jgi:diphthamide synthase (EF-2-diphthine--ammonia ligase)
LPLPAGIDPCSEYGEFHTFVYDGPVFKRPVAVTVGEVVVRDGRYYADLLPAEAGAPAGHEAARIPPV